MTHPGVSMPGGVRAEVGTMLDYPFNSVPLLEGGSEFRGKVGSGNMLIWGENLAAMRALPDSCIQLIYADPPFFTNREFSHLYGDGSESIFSDVWYNGIDGYLSWLRPRLVEMRRLLKEGGTIYLHLDWHASHYAKVMMDGIFGYGNFLNEVIWHYRDPAGTVRDRFKKKHDTILMYAKSAGKHVFNLDDVRTNYSKGTINQGRKGVISFGRPTKLNRLGKAPEDVWEIPIINSQARERIGYPTQKPLRLLQTVVKASSSEGDVVADFFCGSGTTAVAASSLGRNWIAVDSNDVAIRTTMGRLSTLSADEWKKTTRLLSVGIATGDALSSKRNDFPLLALRTLGLAKRNARIKPNPDGRRDSCLSVLPQSVDGHVLRPGITVNSDGFSYFVPVEIAKSPFVRAGLGGKCTRFAMPPAASIAVDRSGKGHAIMLLASSSGSGILSAASIEIARMHGTGRKKDSGVFEQMDGGAVSLYTSLKGKCLITATVHDTDGGCCTIKRIVKL